MTKASILLNQVLDISEGFRVELKAFEVEPSKKYPEGIKVRFVLIDIVRNQPRLLLDNHMPFGFHIHEELPHNKTSRRILTTKNYTEALEEFWRITKEIVKQ